LNTEKDATWEGIDQADRPITMPVAGKERGKPISEKGKKKIT